MLDVTSQTARTDDLPLIAERLRLGLPLRGFADYADPFVFAALARAGEIEAKACAAGDPPNVVVAKVTAVLVSAAVRASVIARGPDVSPSAINRATLSWYELSHLRRRELMMAECAHGAEARSA